MRFADPEGLVLASTSPDLFISLSVVRVSISAVRGLLVGGETAKPKLLVEELQFLVVHFSVVKSCETVA